MAGDRDDGAAGAGFDAAALGARLRAARLASVHDTQDKLAAAMAEACYALAGQQGVGNWERGELKSTALQLVLAWAKATGASPCWLAFGIGERDAAPDLGTVERAAAIVAEAIQRTGRVVPGPVFGAFVRLACERASAIDPQRLDAHLREFVAGLLARG